MSGAATVDAALPPRCQAGRRRRVIATTNAAALFLPLPPAATAVPPLPPRYPRHCPRRCLHGHRAAANYCRAAKLAATSMLLPSLPLR